MIATPCSRHSLILNCISGLLRVRVRWVRVRVRVRVRVGVRLIVIVNTMLPSFPHSEWY